MRKFVLAAVLVLMAGGAQAATLNVIGGQLHGASGVLVDGSLYDVQFLDGTCIDLYNGCDDVSDFTFQTEASATLAAQALLDQIRPLLVDQNGIGVPVDTVPDLTNGCSDSSVCQILTPWSHDGFAVAERNSILSISLVFESSTAPLVTSITEGQSGWIAIYSDDPLGLDDARVYAVWSPVPEPSAVPSMEGPGLGLLVLVLIGLAIRGLRSRATLGLMVLASFVGAADLAEAQVTIPNTFSDGTPALASEVNANFQALASAVNASDCATAADVVCTPSCPACDTLGSYNQGFTAGGNGVDITSDNAAVCTTAGGTYDAGTDSCSVDITTDNAAAEAVAAAAAGSAACTQAGGTWDAGTSTCTAPYNCFIGGFCSQAAIDFPPATNGYTNVYDGHTQTTEPAIGAGCNVIPGSISWLVGSTTQTQDPFFLAAVAVHHPCASN